MACITTNFETCNPFGLRFTCMEIIQSVDTSLWNRLIARFVARLRSSRTFLFATIVFLILWEIGIRLLDIPTYLLPRPSEIVIQFVRNLRLIWRYTLVTATETFAGFFLSLALGIPFSLGVAFSQPMRKTIYPATVALQLVPKIALAPLMITWFGFGITSKILIVFLLCFFPILLNGILGFSSLSTELGYFLTSTGATSRSGFVKIRLPSALPQVFVGIKWAAINATVGATTGEWIGGDAGLGYLIKFASGDLRIDLAFAGIVTLSLLGLFLFYMVVLAEQALVPWHVSQRESKSIV